MIRWPGLIPLFCLLSACNVASVREAPSTIAHNECETNADCGQAGLCTEKKQCRSGTATFQTVLFEVTPPADGSAIAGVQFLVPKELDGEEFGLDLGAISQVAGKVTASKLGCDAKFLGAVGSAELATSSDLSVPALVSLSPASSVLGLYSPRAVAQAELLEDAYFGFSANVPKGTYDIYVVPNRQPDASCPVPPYLVRGKMIEGGTLPLEIEMPEPSAFEFHVTWLPADGALDGWMVDMLDPATGRVISNRVPLALSSAKKTDYVANISYNPVNLVGATKAQQQQDQLVRLSPPDGFPESAAAPTLLLARKALGLFAAGSGTLTEFSSLPAPVHVHGQVTDGHTPTPVAASVNLVAKQITGIEPGVLASLMRTVSTGADGQFDVYLLPGTYKVSTVPLSPLDPGSKNQTLWAADTREWIVPSTPVEQAGKAIPLSLALALTGQVVGASGHPVSTAQVQAVASPLSAKSDVLQDSLGGAAFVPRAAAGGVSGGGDFAFKIDPGTFDITVRPDADTGFAWLVMPNVLVSPEVGRNLGTLSMPLPFPYHGTVTVAGVEGAKVVPGALVRAYIYLKRGQYTGDSSESDSVLQVAETRADKSGAFDVLIPAELNRVDD